MSLRNRPFVGTWQMVNKTVVQHTPDAIVLVNGSPELATCPACSSTINVQKYITQISVDATTDPIATANFSLTIPPADITRFVKNGNYLLQASLEIVVFMKGYFPMKGFATLGQDPSDSSGFDAENVPLYPYYQVFRGVVTNVTHDFSGGFYTATVQAANVLHFWQNQKLATNGAVLGKRPKGSLVEPSLVGHKFTGANPYSIIYTLVKAGFGAAYGVEFLLSQETSVAAMDDDKRDYLFKHAAEWWEKRWTEHTGTLRMYGMDGKIFNAWEQAFLGAWYDTRDKGGKSALFKTAQRIYQDAGHDYNLRRHREVLEKARELGYDPLATRAGLYDTGKKDKDGNRIGATEDVLRMQAFVLDVGRIGSINLFETEYMSRLEIVEAVKTITGFEFYQDVDGDLVFKPPMYNLDTRADPVYRISDRDLMSYNETEGEPEATMCKGTGSHFTNLAGHGMEGWLGVGGVFIDYRLVAKYGYREETFETNYMSSRQAIFVSAINRLDLANIGVRSGSITIPLRPELRPGYPVYVECLDCFYYIQSLSHSFQPGGQCTTTITGVAKRAKWFPPMETTGDGNLPGVSNVRLDAPGEFPGQPLYGYDQYMVGEGGTADSSGPPRTYGFPNVVLAMDPEKANLATVDLSTGLISANDYVQIALTSGALERGETEDTFLLRSGGEPEDVETISLTTFQQEYTSVSDALREGTYEPDLSSTLGKVLHAIQQRLAFSDIPNESNLVNWLALQTSMKGTFAPGTGVQGRYRYYSCSHPEAQHQAPGNLYVDQELEDYSVIAGAAPDSGYTNEVRALKDAGNGMGIALDSTPRAVQRGIRIAAYSQKTQPEDYSAPTETVSTSDIRFVTFGPQTIKKKMQVSRVSSGAYKGTNFALPHPATRDALASLLATRSVRDPEETIKDRFFFEYTRIMGEIQTFAQSLGVDEDSGVAEKAGTVATIGANFDNYSPFPEDVEDKTVVDVYVEKPDQQAMGALAKILASGLWGYIKKIVDVAKKAKGFNADYTEAMEARAAFIEGYTDMAVDVPDAQPGKVILTTDDFRETTDFTPIFPVSDAGGYEVYGNLPYGRGVTIEKYAQLLDSRTEGEETDDAAEASESSVTWVGGVGSNASDLQALEKFMVLWLGGEDPQTILEDMTDPERASILAAANTTDIANITNESIEALQHKDTSQAAKIRNDPVTSFFRGQSIAGEVAAANLAQITLGDEVCVCQGSDAAYLVQAFSEEFVQAYPDDPVQGYLEDRTQTLANTWQAGRDALSGQVSESGPSLEESKNSLKTLGGSSLNQASQAKEKADAALGNLIDGS